MNGYATVEGVASTGPTQLVDSGGCLCAGDTVTDSYSDTYTKAYTNCHADSNANSHTHAHPDSYSYPRTSAVAPRAGPGDGAF